MDLEKTHELCRNNRAALEQAGTGGCFYCGETFEAARIREWVRKESTAMCPICGTDTVLPGAWTDEQLEAMNKHWFAAEISYDDAMVLEKKRRIEVHQRILQILGTDGGDTTSHVAHLLDLAIDGGARRRAAYVRKRLLELQAEGMVRPMDDLKPVCWVKTDKAVKYVEVNRG